LQRRRGREAGSLNDALLYRTNPLKGAVIVVTTDQPVKCNDLAFNDPRGHGGQSTLL